jgi:SAM-dependent methyltransferase
MAVPRDYDENPGRYRLGMQLMCAHTQADLYADIAAMLHRVGAAQILDVGCGEGILTTAVTQTGRQNARVVGLDASAAMLGAHPGPNVQGDAGALPFVDDAFDAVVAANVLYHLAEPRAAIAEARRVLRPGGLFIAAAPSRNDSPELADVWRPAPSTFDAEDAPALVGSVFPDPQVRSWDAPLVTLPDANAVRDYLIVRFVPPAEAAAAAARVATPVTVTKRGALVLARKPTTDG